MKRTNPNLILAEILVATLVVSIPLSKTFAQSPASADENEIHALMTAFAEAFNKGDGRQVAETFIKDGCVTDVDGVTITGQQAIEDRYTTTFRDNPGIQLKLENRSVKVLSPNVAVEEGVAVIESGDSENGGNGSVDVSAPYSAVYVKQDGKWKHAVIRDYFQPPDTPSQRDRLEALKWMLGEWVDEGPDMVSRSTCQWDDGGNFLVWRYQVQDEKANAPGGTTYMGWDPRTAQIRSWLFDADGGHGEATWTRIGDHEWLVKASGVLAGGRTASATQHVKLIAPDRISWTSFDREVGGEALPDISEYVLVRVPPKPGDAEQGTGN